MTTSEQRAAPDAAVTSPFAAREWMIAVLASLAVSLAVVSPFFWLGTASGHDFDFHASSWLEAAAQWKQHIAYPRWHEAANHGFGEPRFIFYPPLSWMLGAALSFVVPWSAVPAMFVVLVQTVACASAFALARRWLPFRGALAAGAFYAANPYAMLVVYVRSDFAEQLASALLPLLFLLALDLSDPVPGTARAARNAVLFALVFAAIWLSNAPAAVLASYTMALVFAWSALATRNWRVLACGAGALALGLGLAAFYILPAAYEQRWVNIEQVQSGGLRPTDNFLYTTTGDPEHTSFNRIASTTALILVVMTGVAAFATRKRQPRTDALQGSMPSGMFQTLLIVSGAATILMTRPSGIAWTLLPELRFVQFPWRWMLILAVPCAAFLGVRFARRLGTLWMAATVAVSVAWGAYLSHHTWWEPDEMPALQAMTASGAGFDGTDEYDPAGDDHEDLPKVAPHVRILPAGEDGQAPAGEVTLLRWSAEEKILRVHTNERARVALRLLNYPGWRVDVNGRPVTPERAGGTAQMVVQVPAGVSRIHVQFLRTMDRTIGGAISVAALLVMLILIVLAATSVTGDSARASTTGEQEGETAGRF